METIRPFRWCQYHRMPDPEDFNAVGGACDYVLLVPSYDASGRLLGMLAADKCVCGGIGHGMELGESKYGKCDGSGYTLRAKRYDGFAHQAYGMDDPVAVLPVERDNPADLVTRIGIEAGLDD